MKDTLYLVYPDSAEAGTLETLPETEGLIRMSEGSFLEDYDNLTKPHKISTTSEATLESILKRITDEETRRAILSMKDKHLFRALLQEDYPSMAFTEVNFEDIRTLQISGKKVLKPIKGCFGTAVKIIDEDSDLALVAEEMKSEIGVNSSVFSESVLSQSEFILEDFIEGEEYAVDMFYDSEGHPHIVNIYYHPLPKHTDYLHMIYYTNRRIFKMLYDDAIAFFTRLNNKLKVKNIALHSEFKYDRNLVPIEINAMRFGGMGLGNMVYHSLKVNPYERFINEQSPNWNAIWKAHPESNFVFFIAYNGTRIDKGLQQPDFNRLESAFTKILNKTSFDYRTQLAFGVYTLEESEANIKRLLEIDFNDYFKPIG
ncbi:ATP-grasp domain-containing protein [Aestuariivivens sediminicola]|uniref:ATP-grasp domain-containing protein n=1 Tax=Aestuariivivens sediminicola TaxID=2913560 RepID=UPI001F5ABDB6|nr:ATP-grasp domain-containing protein [Aestuariivivens sediminicola]